MALNKSNTIEILLSTFNGAFYIDELMQSLCSQSYTDFTLITRDDGSRDDTISRVDSFHGRLTIKRIDNDRTKNLGAMKSFERLLLHSSADCVMLCDQDDIWNENKVERGFFWYNEQKRLYGEIPHLCFSDLTLIDQNNNVINESFMAVHGIALHCINDPYYLIFRNPAPGCSMIINQQLIQSISPIEKTAIMHDWWMIIGACVQGQVHFINEPLVRYRVHHDNVMGITEDQALPTLLSILSLLNLKKLIDIIVRINKHIRQGKTIFRRNEKYFSVFLFWIKFILGRYLMPSVVRVFKRGFRFSWKRLPISQ